MRLNLSPKGRGGEEGKPCRFHPPKTKNQKKKNRPKKGRGKRPKKSLEIIRRRRKNIERGSRRFVKKSPIVRLKDEEDCV